MSDGGFFNFSDPNWGAVDPYGTDPQFGSADAYGSGIESVDVTPQTQLTDYSSTTGGSWDDFLKAIPLIGSTFASTFNAVNHPMAPSAFQSPPSTKPGNAPASAAPSVFDHLLDFHSPYPYLIGGAVLLLVMMHKQSGE
jgi:hypothetical protein